MFDTLQDDPSDARSQTALVELSKTGYDKFHMKALICQVLGPVPEFLARIKFSEQEQHQLFPVVINVL